MIDTKKLAALEGVDAEGLDDPRAQPALDATPPLKQQSADDVVIARARVLVAEGKNGDQVCTALKLDIATYHRIALVAGIGPITRYPEAKPNDWIPIGRDGSVRVFGTSGCTITVPDKRTL